ncbi:MAG TPA: hypothetical protein VN578_02180 [Candidatus Binatia bacterium]|jgi:hypothetical protein|nr:hypothetical protein [Candidatus Binatia bacterium]
MFQKEPPNRSSHRGKADETENQLENEVTNFQGEEERYCPDPDNYQHQVAAL